MHFDAVNLHGVFPGGWGQEATMYITRTVRSQHSSGSTVVMLSLKRCGLLGSFRCVRILYRERGPPIYFSINNSQQSASAGESQNILFGTLPGTQKSGACAPTTGWSSRTRHPS